MDTKGFAKYLPHKTQALQEGKVTPEEVSSDLEGVYEVKTCRLAGLEMNPMMGLAHLYAMSVFPANFVQIPNQREDVVVTFSDELQSKIMEGMTTHQVNPENLSHRLKQYVDECGHPGWTMTS